MKGSGGRRTGSTRHDLGFAADIQIYDGEQLLSVAKSNDLPKIITFCRTIKGKGVKCIGAGPDIWVVLQFMLISRQVET